MLAQCDPEEVRRRLCHEGLALRTGPFVIRLVSPLSIVADGVLRMYGHYELAPDGQFCDFTVEIRPVRGLRRMVRPLVHFLFDGAPVFEPMPADHAYPLMEWGMNWCLAMHAHQYLLLHSAVIERSGHAVILPAPPGSGKSTLCAGLIHAGWRLVSDEMAVVSRDGSGRIWPLCRPVSLKNQSIAIMQDWAPQAIFNPNTVNTTKGTVTHMQAPPAHVERMHESTQARWVIFPRWQAGATARLTPRSRARSVIELGRNAFNAQRLGADGFHLLSDLVERCDCHDFQYSQLGDAVTVFDGLAREVGA
jgi:HprK-related kinase A